VILDHALAGGESRRGIALLRAEARTVARLLDDHGPSGEGLARLRAAVAEAYRLP
jgi:hypothetical protein